MKKKKAPPGYVWYNGALYKTSTPATQKARSHQRIRVDPNNPPTGFLPGDRVMISRDFRPTATNNAGEVKGYSKKLPDTLRVALDDSRSHAVIAVHKKYLAKVEEPKSARADVA